MTQADWYKDAIFYELRVRSFYDSDGDGIGDLKGLTEKLDYIHDLGVTTLWLLPFYPSPLRDDGYDIADYYDVHPAIGTMKDFRRFVKAAHERGIRVVTELVLNHTSDQHPWFQKARRAPPGSPEREFYVWSESPEKYQQARIIFTDYETSNWTWDPVAKAYYWHRFFSHQPDLNFDNPKVRKAMFDAVDFWLETGVDGLRLDAVPYLYERESTSCENLPETHAYLRDLRRHVDRHYPNRMLLAEANQWPDDAVAYFGQGDECHMAFHFPIMPRLYLALRMEDSFPLLDILDQTPAIPEAAQWAIFLRNHDELTLEMVTDEERDLMLRAYAHELPMRINLGIRRRLAPLLGNNRRRIELLHALLFSLPGTPVLYYGDEIGMGDNVYLGDRSGVRTPMQWSPDRNAGFSTANPQRLFLPPIVDPEYHYEVVNVENQQRNPSSLLWWTKRLVGLRKQYPAFGRGSFEPLTPKNRRVLAFLRRHEGQVLLVIANLSRFAQHVKLDLSQFADCAPVELFGGTRFPRIRKTPYQMTLGSHDFFWFVLEHARAEAQDTMAEPERPTLTVRQHWSELFEPRRKDRALERVLSEWLVGRRWFRAKSRTVKTVVIAECIPLGTKNDPRLLFLEVTYASGEPETYIVALGVHQLPGAGALATIKSPREELALVDFGEDPYTARRMLELTLGKKQLETRLGDIVGRPTSDLLKSRLKPIPHAKRLGFEQTNTSFAFGDKVVCKLVRKLESGRSPEVEVLRELRPHATDLGVPRLFGSLDLDKPDGTGATIASFTSFVPNQGTAWQYTVDELKAFYERVLSLRAKREPAARRSRSPSGVASIHVDEPEELIGGYLHAVRTMARSTAGMHRALAASEHPDFVPTLFTPFDRRGRYQALRALAGRAFEMLQAEAPRLPENVRPLAREVLKKKAKVDRSLRLLLERPLTGKLIRIHGDFHLSQVLYNAGAFAIIDFEGEPGRSFTDRRRRRSPLVDVAGMLRSFHYAAYGTLRGGVEHVTVRQEDVPRIEPWAAAWYDWVASTFFEAYEREIASAGLLPETKAEVRAMLDLFVLEKALYELTYELDNRPSWAAIPLLGLLDLTR